jgi:hypothetical protein
MPVLFFAETSNLKMEATFSSKTQVEIQGTKRHYMEVFTQTPL